MAFEDLDRKSCGPLPLRILLFLIFNILSGDRIDQLLFIKNWKEGEERTSTSLELITAVSNETAGAWREWLETILDEESVTKDETQERHRAAMANVADDRSKVINLSDQGPVRVTGRTDIMVRKRSPLFLCGEKQIYVSKNNGASPTHFISCFVWHKEDSHNKMTLRSKGRDRHQDSDSALLIPHLKHLEERERRTVQYELRVAKLTQDVVLLIVQETYTSDWLQEVDFFTFLACNEENLSELTLNRVQANVEELEFTKKSNPKCRFTRKATRVIVHCHGAFLVIDIICGRGSQIEGLRTISAYTLEERFDLNREAQ
ncbi:hypothetical protein BT69DRAFT_1295621 [Atractiella rhizophila]|nr:hypothetical protein BT69DRAFT_1295621 [Atractiella rhizophila]